MSAPWWIVIAAGTSTRSVARRQPPQRGSGSDGRRVLDDTADGEGIRRVERVVVMSPDQLERHQVVVEHQPPQPVEVVVEAGQGGAVGHREHEVVRPGIRDRRRQLIVEFVVAPPEQLERGGDQRRGAERNPERDGCLTAQGDLRHGAEVPDRARVAGARRREDGLGVSDLCGDRLHLPVIGEAVTDPDTRGVAAVGNRREGCQAHEVAAVPGVDVRSGAPWLRP
jgi:hypothetical protein